MYIKIILKFTVKCVITILSHKQNNRPYVEINKLLSRSARDRDLKELRYVPFNQTFKFSQLS